MESFDPCGSEGRTLLKVLLKIKKQLKSHSNAQRLYIFTLTPSQAFERRVTKVLASQRAPSLIKRAAKMSRYWPQWNLLLADCWLQNLPLSTFSSAKTQGFFKSLVLAHKTFKWFTRLHPSPSHQLYRLWPLLITHQKHTLLSGLARNAERQDYSDVGQGS